MSSIEFNLEQRVAEIREREASRIASDSEARINQDLARQEFEKREATRRADLLYRAVSVLSVAQRFTRWALLHEIEPIKIDQVVTKPATFKNIEIPVGIFGRKKQINAVEDQPATTAPRRYWPLTEPNFTDWTESISRGVGQYGIELPDEKTVRSGFNVKCVGLDTDGEPGLFDYFRDGRIKGGSTAGYNFNTMYNFETLNQLVEAGQDLPILSAINEEVILDGVAYLAVKHDLDVSSF